MRAAFAILVACLGFGPAAQAQETRDDARIAIGTARLFTNDFFGDGEDRWRTGGYQISHMRGSRWTGDLPQSFGALREYRLRTEIVAPESLSDPAEGDRRYAGLLSVGVHSHSQMGALDLSLGADVVLLGPQTGVGRFQRQIHKLVGASEPDLSDQIGDDIYLNLLGEAARNIDLGDKATLRPFVEAQLGHETYARVGADLVFGSFGRGGLLTRDVVTGTLMRADNVQLPRMSFLLGGDLAYVDSSALLPSDGPDLTPHRQRLRAGVLHQTNKNRMFYGLTWLSEEFEGQNEGQFVGSVTLDFSF